VNTLILLLLAALGCGLIVYASKRAKEDWARMTPAEREAWKKKTNFYA
jgi:acyl-CoA reductase-like NAD-dependent aldehyde dehydrogenase